MPDPTSPAPPTGPLSIPATASAAYLRRIIEQLGNRVARLEANRSPDPLLMHQLQNAGPMSQVKSGAASVYDQPSGTFMPSPVFAEHVFHMQGTLTVATSAPNHVRYPCFLIGVTYDLGTFAGGPVTFNVLVNGSPVVNRTVTSAKSGPLMVNPPIELAAYDVIEVQTTSVDASADLVVHVEYGASVATNFGPR